MVNIYTEKQYEELFQKLPEELQEVVFSMKTADTIFRTCLKNNVKEVSRVAAYVGDVLMGVLSPAEFQSTIEKEIKLSEKKAEVIAKEINRFVFYPVRPLLEELYKTELPSPERPITTAKTERSKTPTAMKAKPEKSPRKDVYREPIE